MLGRIALGIGVGVMSLSEVVSLVMHVLKELYGCDSVGEASVIIENMTSS